MLSLSHLLSQIGVENTLLSATFFEEQRS